MKKIVIFFLSVIAFSINAKSQTFVCTDYNYIGNEMSPQEMQKEKKQLLGSEVELTIYDKSLRISRNVDRGRKDSYILDKIGDNVYQLKEKRGNNQTMRRVIKLHKIIAYIKSFTYECYIDGEKQGALIFKRK